jgi:cycloeucalenol cycloisomerase
MQVNQRLSEGWFSDNPDRARAEKFFLAWTPVWMALMALMMFTGWTRTASDGQLILHSLLVALPLVLIPALWFPNDIPWYRQYAFKANVYMAVFSFFGNYVGSEYFFDVLGMVYAMPNATTTLDARLVGSGEQTVPLIMYFYTQAYFMTYHTTAILVLRRLMSAVKRPKSGASHLWRGVIFLVCVVAVGYAWAWIETRAMANPLLTQTFWYKDMDAMLAWGSLAYATYFLASFPIFYFLDEDARKPWSLAVTASAAMSASLLTFYFLEICVVLMRQA